MVCICAFDWLRHSQRSSKTEQGPDVGIGVFVNMHDALHR